MGKTKRKPRPVRLENRKPSFQAAKTLELVEVPAPPLMERLIIAANSYLRAYRLGECSVFVTREFDSYHLSIAHPSRYPTWEEASAAWYRAVPGARTMTGALVLPPIHEYINVHKFCLQIMQIGPQPDAAGRNGG